MAKTRKATWRDQLKKLVGATTDAEFEEKLGEEAPVGDEPASSPESGGSVTIHNHLHGQDEAPSNEGGRKIWDEGELPPWFVEHVANNNARFDELNSALAGISARLPGTGDAEETPEEKAAKAKAAEEADKARDAEGENFEQEAPPGTGDKARKAHDSAYFADSFQETAAIAEILAPGIQLPTFDAKEKPKATFDAICGLRRRALEKASADEELKPFIEASLGAGRTLDKMSCDAVRMLFKTVGAAKKRANSQHAQRDGATAGAGGGLGVQANRKIKSIAELNKAMSQHYAS